MRSPTALGWAAAFLAPAAISALDALSHRPSTQLAGFLYLFAVSLAASAPPQELIRDIDAHVLTVETHEPRAVASALSKLDWIKSVAQIGQELHVLVKKEVDEPVERVRGAVAAAGATASVHVARTSLEDVFVAVTGPWRKRVEAKTP